MGAPKEPDPPSLPQPWEQIEAEVRSSAHKAARLPLRAYSEQVPPPYIGIKPYAPARARAATTHRASDGRTLDISEYEQAHDLEPGLDRIAEHLLSELGRLQRGEPHALSTRLLDGNPAWPAELAEAARTGRLAHDPLTVVCPLALSRTQDAMGNHRFTLFGASHEGPAAPLFDSSDEATLAALLAWAGCAQPHGWRILAEAHELPESLRPRQIAPDAPLEGVRTLVTFRPFAQLPASVRAAYLAGTLSLFPSPVSLVLFEHPGYKELARELPHARQIPLLHLFPRIEQSCAIRIPQSGWLDEPGASRQHGHRIVPDLLRTHRWQRIDRDAGLGSDGDGAPAGDGVYTDPVSIALFSTEPAAIDLYDKPLARNAQLWTADYRLLLDGPRADRQALLRAARATDAGGRFGYRMHYAPMRAGLRELFWHLPLIARAGTGRLPSGPLGYVTAEAEGLRPLRLLPRLLARPEHVLAARCFPRDPGRRRHTTSHNARKLLDTREQLVQPLTPSLARALVRIARGTALTDWLAHLPTATAQRTDGEQLAAALQGCLGDDMDPGAPLVLDRLGTRAFEEQIWATIAHLAHGDFRQKNDADGIAHNLGLSGGPAAQAARIVTQPRRDLEALGDHLHARYRALIEAHGMTGRAEVLDHVFRWETDFDFEWMHGWAKNQHAPNERNVILRIPGRNRAEAVVMADHYDTAYMEDVFYKEHGGDSLRAPACGADDNHSATTALLLAAELLLPLARAGRLERDVWLVHLTGEEFPADCLGARALVQALVERRLELVAEDGARRDVSQVEVVAAFVLDMIGHNTERGRDIFQIAPGEGAEAARLAVRAHRANQRWNRCAALWNHAPERHSAGRAQRMPDDKAPPPLFSHLPLTGEIRVEWEPRSALYNTDGQIFSDLGIPVVLFMENYDISRRGYHDTHDTMENIDLDYCAALTAIAIETVAETACAPDLRDLTPLDPSR